MSLYSKIIDLQKLNAAWKKVRANKPAAGIDEVTWEMYDADSIRENKLLNEELRMHEYTCKPVKTVILYKENKERQIALYSMRDKVVQQSIAEELTKIYDSQFTSQTYAYRSNKSALLASEEIERRIHTGRYRWVLKIDIQKFFDSIRWVNLEQILRIRNPEEDVLELIRSSCCAPVIDQEGNLCQRRVGIHQGSSIAPVLSNIYLMDFDKWIICQGIYYVRYSDDILILGEEKERLLELLSQIQVRFETLGLAVSEKKTVLCSIEEGVEFLGFAFDQKGKCITSKAEKQLKTRLESVWFLNRDKTCKERLRKMSEILNGWEQYFRGKREPADILEYAAVAYMVRTKKEIRQVAEKRTSYSNIYPDILKYLLEIWEENDRADLCLYEYEQYYGFLQGVRKENVTGPSVMKSLDGQHDPDSSCDNRQHMEALTVNTVMPTGKECDSDSSEIHHLQKMGIPGKNDRNLLPLYERISSEAMKDLLLRYKDLLGEESKDNYIELMQTYADYHQYEQASAVSEKISLIENQRDNKTGIDVSHLRDLGDEGDAQTSFEEEEIEQYMNLFVGREDVFAVIEYLQGRKTTSMHAQPLTKALVTSHLSGECVLATYVQRQNATVKYVVLDVDVSRKVLIECEGDRAKLTPYLRDAANVTAEIGKWFHDKGIKVRYEFSGGRGYHVWLFFDCWIPAYYVNMLQDVIEKDFSDRFGTELTLEFFPNKTKLRNGKIGQCIKLPLSISREVAVRSALLDDDFCESGSLKEWIHNTPRYSLNMIKKIVASSSGSQSDNPRKIIDSDLTVFGDIESNIHEILERCNLMRYLCRKALDTGYLTHFERLSVLYVFGHVGEEGKRFVHQVMGYTINYKHTVTEKFIRKCPEKPISCMKLRDQYKCVTAEIGCSCVFRRNDKCYPSPVLHAISSSNEESHAVTLPISRTISAEKSRDVADAMNIHIRAQQLASRIVELKRQRRGIDSSVRKIEKELERLFDEEKIESLELEMGLLIRRKTGNGYEWLIEI